MVATTVSEMDDPKDDPMDDTMDDPMESTTEHRLASQTDHRSEPHWDMTKGVLMVVPMVYPLARPSVTTSEYPSETQMEPMKEHPKEVLKVCLTERQKDVRMATQKVLSTVCWTDGPSEPRSDDRSEYQKETRSVSCLDQPLESASGQS